MCHTVSPTEVLSILEEADIFVLCRLGARNSSNERDARNKTKGGVLNKQGQGGEDERRGRRENTRRQEGNGGNFPEPSSDEAAGEGLRGERLPEGSSGSTSSRRSRGARMKRDTPKGGGVYKSEGPSVSAVDEGDKVLPGGI